MALIDDPGVRALIRKVYGPDVLEVLLDHRAAARTNTQELIDRGFNPRRDSGIGLDDDGIPSDAFGDW